MGEANHRCECGINKKLNDEGLAGTWSCAPHEHNGQRRCGPHAHRWVPDNPGVRLER